MPAEPPPDDREAVSKAVDCDPAATARFNAAMSGEFERGERALRVSAALPPKLPADLLPFRPWLRLWRRGGGVSLTRTSWTVFGGPHTLIGDRKDEPARCLCRRARWRFRGPDAARMRAFLDPDGDHAPRSPDIEVADAEIDPGVISAFAADLAAIRLPAVAEPPGPLETLVIDGGRVGFEYHHRRADPPATASFEWTYDVPAAWEPLTDRVDALIADLDGLFPD